MSDPIDFIDLTVDSPKEKYLKSRSKNDENISNNSTTKSKKYKSSKQQLTELYDSVIEISIGSTYKDVEAMEIIDVDNIKPSEQNAICYDSTQGNSIMLTCPICFEKLSSQMKPMSTRCGHIFCAHCIKQALRLAKNCPTCKRACKFQSCTRLYF
ncbi:peroxisome biogenesis factor 10-like [Osmia bicornis bicornis]|uniref:peroxisome biogenesis factor 10-like n=1 Tax=Osmia bicornis bicornis TaxID=1437191 RepID=UPI0010F63B01|nr:peroxisome biogenesis factor 10-like [Osmia bicornis bicornis]